MNTTTFPSGQLSSSVETANSEYVAYIAVMFVILAFGLFGNALTILVLYQPSHRNETLTPLMLNLAFAGLFITIFGYPMSTSVILTGGDIGADQTRCNWYGFVNGTVGITSIATFTGMTFVMSYSMHQMNPRYKFSRKVSFCLIVASWVYGVVIMLPPLLGWTRIVPGVAGVSCGPDWTDLSPSGMAYSLLLIVFGFFVPMSVISVCYFKIFRILRQDFGPENNRIRLRRRQWQMKLARLTAIAVAAFMLSWSPYCFVSLVSIFKGNYLLSPGEAEVPELMAKASVIYNPFVYTFMNRRFRMTLWAIVSCRHCKWRLFSKSKESSSDAQECVTEKRNSIRPS
ncbi:hypothetical protein ACROYT_G010690 [Oculina patagonica]